MKIAEIAGVPKLVSQAFPDEVWSIGEDCEMSIEMGTEIHRCLILSAKANEVVKLVTTLEFPPRKRGPG